ncbi:HAD family hydrolase [Tuwongella immobilis]|uniref:phosphoglycolate phosphatase n=1 Tax=Tuwongella immobilis TaxID=692036 RepID=A0A6C2YI46_9BACT|nr:HAD family hydrolase [Tuwongella immobilis]VIP00735.1 Putative phosphatase OS=Singulisphaera acidiphila (strain ATCC BAA-1392 / DSM 18658 / VKM B-2454 / MOB10) GN=Sinac_0541 PE=4 SV=1: HAD [Tuwongella immobilis]VTR96888.1 Putative phosphatase OS=Singulisphaera acidiphila (strain ATCC BAA-1392 / DSM 18658 / VKM B-2454 / MOB10) GN=Sinac_0541 PE=4 SV=1: HAD [Tuwongella immobilis]
MSEFPASVEVVRSLRPRGGFRAVMFDFDGTLSLVRGGWMELMTEQMLTVLRDAGSQEPEPMLRHRIVQFILDLVGQPTMRQMERLADEVARLGATPQSPDVYLRNFLRELKIRVEARMTAMTVQGEDPERFRVPHAIPMLDWLQGRQVPCVLASGTERIHVVREARALQLVPFFGERIYGPGDGHVFSKRAVIEQMMHEWGIPGEQILGFGDGVSETEEIHRVGGIAVAVASDESGGGIVDPIKRERLIRAGADLVIPDYRDALPLLHWLSTH